MDLRRVLRHGWSAPLELRRALPPAALARIESAVADAERVTSGQIRFAVEADLPLRALWRDVPARQRATELFSALRVWDTEHNSGVLIYVLLADRQVEVIADRGIARRVAQAEWDAICRTMEAEFREGRLEQGAMAGIKAAGVLLARHFPRGAAGGNELPDAPVIVR